ARCGMPDLLQNLVCFPEPLLIEQIDSFSQRFLFPSDRNTGFKRSECHHLRHLGFQETLGVVEVGLLCEEIELDRARSYSEVADLICGAQQFSNLRLKNLDVAGRVAMTVSQPHEIPHHSPPVTECLVLCEGLFAEELDTEKFLTR